MRKWSVVWLAGAATSIIFVMTKVLVEQNTSFVVTKVCLPRQNLSRDKRHVCHDETLVATKMILAAAPASDRVAWYEVMRSSWPSYGGHFPCHVHARTCGCHSQKQNQIAEVNGQLSELDSNYRALEHSSELHRNKVTIQRCQHGVPKGPELLFSPHRSAAEVDSY